MKAIFFLDYQPSSLWAKNYPKKTYNNVNSTPSSSVHMAIAIASSQQMPWNNSSFTLKQQISLGNLYGNNEVAYHN